MYGRKTKKAGSAPDTPARSDPPLDSSADCDGEPQPVKGPKVRVLLLTSESPSAVRKAVAKNINATFADVDVAVLSPAVTAGSSCTIDRFTAAVCIAENLGHDGPTVDGCLQQWWRVRSLGADGRMFVYILDSASNAASGISEFLEANLGTSYNFLSLGLRSAARNASLAYDRGSLAYEALTGVIHMRHKSISHFSEILKGALQHDYGVPTTETAFAAITVALDHNKKSNKEKRDDEKARAEAVRFSAYSGIIGDLQAGILTEQRKASVVPLTDEQLQQLHVYVVDPELCDADFFESYVQTCFNKEDEKMVKQFYAFQRFHMAWQQPLAQLSAKYRELL